MRRVLLIFAAIVVALDAVLYATTTSFAPTSDVTVTNWTALGGGTKFSEIDEAPGDTASNDGDTSYMQCTTNNTAVRLGITNPAIPNGATINSVQILAVAKEVGGDAGLRLRIYVNGVAQICGAAADQLTTSYAVYGGGSPTTCSWATNPVTAVAWTEADIEGTSAAPLNGMGFQATDITNGVDFTRVTQAYVIVDYTAAAGGGTSTGSILLLGVGGDR